MPASHPHQLLLFGSAPTAEPARPAPAPRQAPPSGGGPAARLAVRLRAHLGSQLHSLTLTDNRTRIVSARPGPRGQGLEVRIHRCFVDAPAATVEAVAAFLLSKRAGPARRSALQTIRDHFAQCGRDAAAAAARLPALRPAGRAFDLRQLRDALNAEYFAGALEVEITWGRTSTPRRRRRRQCGFSILLGSYDARHNLVRIHRCLDGEHVPRYVVESVVYHEMLHAALPAEVVDGRRRLHTPEFRRRERLFRHHEAASRWLERHLESLAGFR